MFLSSLSDDIGQDFEMDLVKRMGFFGFNHHSMGGDGDCPAHRHQGYGESIYLDPCLPILLMAREASQSV